MNKKVIVYIIIVIVILGIIGLFAYKKFYNPVSKQVTYTTSAEYTASIDYSCKKSSDCEIKDVHNCCGEYRQCVSKKAKTDPDFITKACAKEGIGSICGAPAINQCDCVDKKCVGVRK